MMHSCVRVDNRQAVVRLAFSSDGTRLLSAGEDRSVILWDAAAGHLLHRLEGHAGPVQAVVVSPDGRHALSAGHDRTVRVWDASSGKELLILGDLPKKVEKTPPAKKNEQTKKEKEKEKEEKKPVVPVHPTNVKDAVFSPDGVRVASATGQWSKEKKEWLGEILLWDAKNGKKTLAIVEIPYNLNKTNLIERIAELVKEDHIGGISDVRDGEVVGFRGDGDHPTTRGWRCAKVRPYLGHVYHPDRLLQPLHAFAVVCVPDLADGAIVLGGPTGAAERRPGIDTPTDVLQHLGALQAGTCCAIHRDRADLLRTLPDRKYDVVISSRGVAGGPRVTAIPQAEVGDGQPAVASTQPRSQGLGDGGESGCIGRRGPRQRGDVSQSMVGGRRVAGHEPVDHSIEIRLER